MSFIERVMQFAISIPQLAADGEFDPSALGSHLARAEALGFHSAWAQEHVFGSAPMLEPLETLTFAAALTSTLRLGCAVFVTSLRSPVHLAKSVATLDQLSRGRLEVGIGVGGGPGAGAFGVDPATRASRFSEGLELMKACWTRQRIDHHGRFWQVDGAAMEPKPFQKPHPPLWIGARRPTALRRAAEMADGFFGAGSATTAEFVEHVRVVRAALAGAGREATSFPIAKRVYIAVDDDASRARSTIDQALEHLYGRSGLLPVAVAGTPDDCVHGLREVADGGANLILLNPLRDDREQMERLAAEVVPQLLDGTG